MLKLNMSQSMDRGAVRLCFNLITSEAKKFHKSNRTTMSVSSSDDDACCHDNRSIELHGSSKCKYQKHKINVDERTVYILLRSCECDKFKTLNPTSGQIDLKPMEGKDIHFSDECKWKKSKKDDGVKLRRKCVCKGPENAGYIGTTTYTFSPE